MFTCFTVWLYVSTDYYTGRFIKNQQKYPKLIQLFTSRPTLRNKNTERKGKIRQHVVYTT